MGDNPQEQLVKRTGGCHCGGVRFEVWAPLELHVYRCNCSICLMKQNHHFIVPRSRLKIIKGSEQLTTYTFNSRKAHHTFCKQCGVQSFYTPRSNPDGYGVTVYCLDSYHEEKIAFEDFDGANWEDHFAKTDISKWSKK